MMAQPEFVPIVEHDRSRVGERIPPVPPGRADRPGMLDGRPRSVSIGPDQGYALKLASHLRPRLVLAPHEHVEDVIAGGVEVALRRAGRLGRAPVVFDVSHGFNVFGYLGNAPDDLVEFRRSRFEGVAHLYNERVAIGALVREETLAMTPEEVAAAVARGEWRTLLALETQPTTT